MYRAFLERIGEFTEMHPVLTLSLGLLFGISTLLFVLTLSYSLIFFYWLGL